MDQIDLNLLEAWDRIGELCRHDRTQALLRSRRRLKPTVFRPVRPWCLCLRAADTRINEMRAIIDPAEYDERQLEHEVSMRGDAIGFLTQPVEIPWPGVTTWHAAPLLGVSHHRAWQWAKRGVLRIEHYDYCRMHSRRCKPIPIVTTWGPFDPNHPDGRPPDPVWGSLWQSNWKKLPDDFGMTATRVPRYLVRKGQTVFRGWDWICPGRKVPASQATTNDKAFAIDQGHDFMHQPCGRRCKYLFAPLPVWTLGKSTGFPLQLEMPADSGLAGAWEPGMQEIEVGKGHRTFACKHCWNLHCITLSNHTGWNDFVTHISGGLLYGHEVERPLEEAPYIRKRRYAPRPRRVKVAIEIAASDVI